ncbi:GNAT family N-acetyltransferase [Aeromicrobium sp.]|uniref:GNAT family N-acetyltransferase n=1 Tax=Aeromicrobium sp. TaxID=1871063 RepID=UPI0025BCDC21|nr:GNAT family N-acetyltransferase [Aeromicrobium sp.]MCK5890820.1 GNAT family N-acetyltransferase [Aeromicrobium sp.]
MRPRLPLTVRPATLDDAEALAELWQHAVDEGGEAGAGHATLWHRPDPAEATEALAFQLDHPHRGVWVALHEDDVVGAVAATVMTVTPVTTTRALVVTDLVVDPSRRRHGIAWQMLLAVAEHGEAQECALYLAIIPGAAREPARYLAKLGFSPVASVRAITSQTLRARVAARATTSPTGRMLAVRRSMRRREGRSG